MTDEEIDKILQKASAPAPEIDPALLKRIADTINSTLQPVHPRPPARVLSIRLGVLCAVLAAIASAGTGFFGVEKLALWKSVVIFSTLGILLSVAATSLANQVIPGSRQSLGTAAILIGITAALLGVFVLVFPDYHIDRFVPTGLRCLLTGLLVALLAAALSWWVIRRDFAVNALTAGLATGTLAGLCGVTMLELHCPELLAPHVLVWHTAVLPVSSAVGVLLGWMLRHRSIR